MLRRSPTAIPLSLFSVFELLITLITNYLEKFIKLLSSDTTSVVLLFIFPHSYFVSVSKCFIAGADFPKEISNAESDTVMIANLPDDLVTLPEIYSKIWLTGSY